MRALRPLLVAALAGTTAIAAQLPRAGASGVPTTLHTSTGSAVAGGGRSAPFTFALPVNAAELSPGDLRQAVTLAKAAGAAQIDGGAPWWYVMPAPGTYNWGFLDRLVAAAAGQGMPVALELSGTPDWAHPDVAASVAGAGTRIWYPPRGQAELALWSDYVGAVVQRYGAHLRAINVWNEPNVAQSWKPAPSPSEYAALLEAAYVRAKQVDPAVTVTFGGLSRNDVGYLDAYYAAAGQLPSAAADHDFFDSLDAHPYSDDHSPDYVAAPYQGAFGEVVPSFGGLADLEQALVAHGDGNKPIFIGEYGFSTATTWMPAVPDAVRALYAKRALAIASSLPYVSGMAWYSFLPDSADGPQWSIMDSTFQPSATYAAVQQAMRDGPQASFVQVHLPGTTLTGTVTVSGTYTGPPQRVVETVAYADGVIAGSGVGAQVTVDTRALTNGAHRLLLAAYTANGSVYPSSPVTVTVHNAAALVSVQAITLVPPSAAGRAATVDVSVAATSVTTVDDLVVAVRQAPSGTNVDFPGEAAAVLGPTATTFTFSRTFGPGTYTYWVAYELGGAWHDIGTAQSFTVA